MNERKDLFRKASLDQAASPERINDYIKVANPSVWVILAAIALLLIAGIIWGATYQITPDGLRPLDFLFGRG